MAIDTLVSVSSGGGWGIAETIGGTAVLDDVFICRPLSQMVDAEIGHQVLLSELPSHLHSATTFVSTTTNRKHTIPSLITDFLTKLEDGYPMTSSVINRAANKIGHRAPSDQKIAGTEASYRICPTCRLPSDPRANSWKKSITLASHASTPHQVTSTLHEEPIKLSDHLCYSCLGTFRDRSQFSTLSTDQEIWTRFPDYVMKSVQQQGPNRGAGKYEEMRKMIEGFLIDPDTE
ncbi:hypothetical protein CROQUDRAFT_675750 [Cronartium quercuum f. sp. fusiforme G11]|uniref:Uncharacterized protein n=1 Tax=Cronartium quercuum f. sp. fusiforme G11 TaxID=708437 RepID=A0A9P6NS51_9BASI|nr:hypothetical protein CROQUDRAFT_675750 [Cronartium quercuum f. sp. fusiforme G11]